MRGEGTSKTASAKETVLTGLGVAPGIGIGVAYVREAGAIDAPEYEISAEQVEPECRRLRMAATAARRQIQRLQEKAQGIDGAAGEELGYLLDAYFHMLKDSRLVRGSDRRIREYHVNAEAAVHAEMKEIARQFAGMDDAYLAARVADVREVGNRLIRSLTRRGSASLADLPEDTLVVAEEVTPAEAAQLDPTRIRGIAAMVGGAEGHTAIMARALGMPAVLGVPGLLSHVRSGDTILVDGDAGRVVVNPGKRTLATFERRRRERLREARKLVRLKEKPAESRDGVTITLQANIELPIELRLLPDSGAQGIGLLRSEFQFMNRRDVPGEDEQYESLMQVVAAMGDRPVTVRTLDVGGEKTSAALMGEYSDSAGSALGLRGIRLSLARTDLLETQFRAILRAAVAGNVRVLLPMVTTVSEIRKAREVLKRAHADLRRRGVDLPDDLPPLGVMIEVPGAALAADALARAADFFAVGSNDLTMYTLAIDRGDEQVAALYDSLHPAVLRLIQFSAAAAGRAGIPVSICGEMAGDPRYAALLLGLGFRDLSMVPPSIPRVKQRIREMDLAAAARRADLIMGQVDSGRIATLLDDFNGLA
ncbi:MAG: phosphoenolpyruvate--protein phosphotransferase [Hyphomicrobiales bacterium]|nr:phosphoenolpyruvate--protein phosphotransferase [Hyphomicrobiales bacterium]